MKKKLATLLALVLAVGTLAACGKEETTGTDKLADATVENSVELVETEETDLSLLPVEEYVTVGDYKSMEVSVVPIKELTEEEFEEYLQSYFYSEAAKLPKDKFATEGTVQIGDVILLDYSGKVDGEVFEGGTASDQTLGIGSGQFIEGFEDGLVGVEVGETVDLNLTFPEQYTEELAGKDVVFTVTVKGIASMNDETIKAFDHDGYETVEDYREAVAYFAEYELQTAYASRLTDAISEQLLEISTATKLPKKLYEQERALMVDQINLYGSMYGLDGDTYAQYLYGMNLNDYATYMTEAYLVRGCILQVIANKEGISPTDEEIDAYVQSYIESYGPSYNITSEEDFYENTSREDVKVVMLQEKVISFLANTIKINYVEETAE